MQHSRIKKHSLKSKRSLDYEKLPKAARNNPIIPIILAFNNRTTNGSLLDFIDSEIDTLGDEKVKTVLFVFLFYS